MKTNLFKRLIVINVVILFFMGGTTIYAQQVDSTKVRKTTKCEKTTAQKILSVPQFIIGLPFDILEFATKGTINNVIDAPIGRKIYTAIAGVDRVWGFYPIAGYGSNSGIKGGLGFRSKGVFTREERLKIKGSYSNHEYQSYKIRYIAPNFFQSNNGITFLLSYKKRPWESFYGLGNNSLESNEAAFTKEQTYFQMGGLWSLSPEFVINLTGAYQATNLYDGEDPNLEGDLDIIKNQLNLSQLDIDPARIWSINGTITHDTRNHKGRPTEGGIEILTFSYNNGVDKTDNLKFTNTSIDLRRYFKVFRNRILLIRLMAISLDTQKDSPGIPFYLQNNLGGSESIRGFRRGRFIGYDAALASFEYRYPIWDVLDAFIFLDEGRIFKNISKDFTLKEWHSSYGIGLKIWNPEAIVFSLQTAFGKEGSRFYLQLSESF